MTEPLSKVGSGEPGPFAPRRPNLLFLIVDQMQGQVLDPDHVCQTPGLDRLAARGVRFTRAYAPSPICSPSRASLMTGRLPHDHGVTDCTHVRDSDQLVLREDRAHWAQGLRDAGYRTGYFGKWHIERSNQLDRFGWSTFDIADSGLDAREHHGVPTRSLGKPSGYREALLYGVTDLDVERRGVGVVVEHAAAFLADALSGDEPWACVASVFEPHDPYLPGRAAFEQYDVDAIELPPSWDDDLAGRPNVYRKSARAFADLTMQERRKAAACYYASITEVDAMYERLISMVEAAGKLEDTIIVFTSDHGEFLGAHGLYFKNVGAFEEAYRIPLILAGPGIARGAVSDARIGLQDLAPTLCELLSVDWVTGPGSRSFLSALADPAARSVDFTTGFAEYEGSIYGLTQRVLWQGPWKLVWNGFDFDELYRLDEDPNELCNLADDPSHQVRLREMFADMWRHLAETGDWALHQSSYPPLRLASFGPGPLLHIEPDETSPVLEGSPQPPV